MASLSPAVEAFVNAAAVGRLATVDERGRPHLVPVCFAYQAGRVYSVLDAKPKRVAPTELRRVRNILANPEVQLLVDHYEDDWRRLAYVQLRGRASLLYEGVEHAAGLRLLRAKYSQYATMDLDGAPIIAIEVAGATAWGAVGDA
jgi:PPOX class probable F420-dependent enzyme